MTILLPNVFNELKTKGFMFSFLFSIFYFCKVINLTGMIGSVEHFDLSRTLVITFSL